MDPTTASTRPAERVIFVATDLSASADEALRQAHLRARTADARLVVCHVIPTLVRTNMLFPHRTVEQMNVRAQYHEQALDALVMRTGRVTGRAPDEFTPVVDDGPPYAGIVAHAEVAGAELIVVGDRGAAGVTRVVLGSVAERVVRYAHSPVLVARPSAPTGRVLVATDLSDLSLPALEAAAREARRPGVRVTAVFCTELGGVAGGPDYGIGGSPGPTPELVEETGERARTQLTAALRRVHLEGDARVMMGEPATAILAAAEELKAELIVIGTRGKTGVWRVLLGSVAEAVVRHAACSVLVVRLDTEPRPAAAASAG